MEVVKQVNPSVEAADSIGDAVEKSLKNAGEEDAVIIFGSLSFLGEALKEVTNRGKYNG
jgi:dihydrofolate synthase/folylpolyglutamate synthase